MTFAPFCLHFSMHSFHYVLHKLEVCILMPHSYHEIYFWGVIVLQVELDQNETMFSTIVPWLSGSAQPCEYN
jgi:hypothetical protein